jgi:hypothetical protein
LEPSHTIGSPVEQPVNVSISHHEASLRALSRSTMSFYVTMNIVFWFLECTHRHAVKLSMLKFTFISHKALSHGKLRSTYGFFPPPGSSEHNHANETHSTTNLWKHSFIFSVCICEKRLFFRVDLGNLVRLIVMIVFFF